MAERAGVEGLVIMVKGTAGRVSVLEMLTGKRPAAPPPVEVVSEKLSAKKKKKKDESCIRLGSGGSSGKPRAWLYRPCSKKRKAENGGVTKENAKQGGPKSREVAETARRAVSVSEAEEKRLAGLVSFLSGLAPAPGASAPSALSLGLRDLLERERRERRTSRRLRQRTLRQKKAKRETESLGETEKEARECQALKERYKDYLYRKTSGSHLHWEQRYRPIELGNHKTANSGACERIRKWLEGWPARSSKSNDGWWSSDEEGDFVCDDGDEKRLRRSGLLLHGPPGCGKTAAIWALACSCQSTVVEVNSSESRTGDKLKKK